MLGNKFLVRQRVFNVWDKEMILDILIDSSINWFFQKADLSDSGGRNTTPNRYKLKKFYTIFAMHLASYKLYDILLMRGPWQLNEIQNRNSSLMII